MKFEYIFSPILNHSNFLNFEESDETLSCRRRVFNHARIVKYYIFSLTLEVSLCSVLPQLETLPVCPRAHCFFRASSTTNSTDSNKLTSLLEGIKWKALPFLRRKKFNKVVKDASFHWEILLRPRLTEDTYSLCYLISRISSQFTNLLIKICLFTHSFNL